MLGYIRTDAPELRLRDSECYRAIYCGLCREMGKCTGQCSRLSLSYDFAFLAAFRMSLTNEKLDLQKKRCAVHPLKKRSMAIDSPSLAYCADASAILTYHKCRDDVDDEKASKSFAHEWLRDFSHGLTAVQNAATMPWMQPFARF